MKRSSSSTKENGLRNTHKKQSIRKRPIENQLNSLSSTQTFFPSTNTPGINTSNSNLNQFYKTIGSNNFM